MRVGIDARFAGPVGRGLGRYTAELLRNLALLDPPDEFVVFTRRDNQEFVPDHPRFRRALADFPWYSFAEQIRLPGFIRRSGVDLMHFPHFNVPVLSRAPFVVTIHDLILRRFPTHAASTRSRVAHAIKRIGYHAVIAAAVRRAENIIAVSNFTAGEIVDAWPSVRERVRIISEGVSHLPESCEPAAGVLGRYGIVFPYFLYVGSCYPHKNVEGLLAAYRRLREIEPDPPALVIAGIPDRFSEQIGGAMRRDGPTHVHFIGFVPDGELAAFYREAVAYVCPSRYEGFGLPPLEALACGARVVAHRATALPEVLGEAALFTDACDPDRFAADLRRVWRDPPQLGAFDPTRFSWRAGAEATYAVYCEAYGASRR